MPGPSISSLTSVASASFEVPTRPPGVKSMPWIGQRNPVLWPVTGRNGNSETRVPAARSSASRGGA